MIKPKTFKDMEERAGYDTVAGMFVPSSSFESRENGRRLYQKTCDRCHGEDGTPNDISGSLSRYNMANLAYPNQYKLGSDKRAIFRSIAFGTDAPPHGLWKGIYSDKDIWNLAAYVESLQAKRR